MVGVFILPFWDNMLRLSQIVFVSLKPRVDLMLDTLKELLMVAFLPIYGFITFFGGHRILTWTFSRLSRWLLAGASILIIACMLCNLPVFSGREVPLLAYLIPALALALSLFGPYLPKVLKHIGSR